MWFSPIFDRFVEKSPVTVIVRALMEVVLAEPKLDELFEQTAQTGYTKELLFSTLPKLKARWSARHNRPLPESVQVTLSKFYQIWIADSSTLEALFRKLKSLSEVKSGSLAGKMGVLKDTA